MKLKIKKMNLFALAVTGLFFSVVQAEVVYAGTALEGFQKLSAADQKIVQDGGQVVQFGNETPWPSALIYQRIQATPEESAAVFTDYAYQTKYIPNLKEAKPTLITKTVYEVSYQAKIPFLPIVESYTVRDELTTYDKGHAYLVTWNLVPGHGESVNSSTGYAKFEDLGGATLLAYYSLIVPRSFFAGAGPIVNGAKDAIKKSVSSMVQQIEKEKQDEPTLLQKQLEEMKAALSN